MDEKRMQAARLGERRYKGNPCKKCGERLRYTVNGNCVACSQEHATKYRKRISDLIKVGGD
jgi:hypothetical protein